MENWIFSYAYLVRNCSVGNTTSWVALITFELKDFIKDVPNNGVMTWANVSNAARYFQGHENEIW